MAETRVEIDLNDIDADGLTTVLLTDASGPLSVGDVVTAFESEDSVAAPATVVSIDDAHGLAALRVEWRSMVKELVLPKLDGLIVLVESGRVAQAQGWSTPSFVTSGGALALSA